MKITMKIDINQAEKLFKSVLKDSFFRYLIGVENCLATLTITIIIA